MKPPRSLHVSIHGRNKGMFSVWLKRQAFWFYSSLLLQLRWVIMWLKERVKPLTGKAAPRLWKYLVCAEATKRLQHLNLSHFEFDFSDTEFPDLEDQHQEKVFINVTEPSEQVWKSSWLEIHYLFFFGLEKENSSWNYKETFSIPPELNTVAQESPGQRILNDEDVVRLKLNVDFLPVFCLQLKMASMLRVTGTRQNPSFLQRVNQCGCKSLSLTA